MKNKLKHILFPALVLTFLSHTASAAPEGLSYVLIRDVCTSNNVEASSACDMYIIGVVEGWMAGRNRAATTGSTVIEAICTADGSVREIVDAVKEKFLRNEDGVFEQFPAGAIISAIAVNDFPCN
jgi:hypothetical protein